MLRTRLTDSLLFARKFLTRPAVDGSLVPSSSVACRSMLRDIDFSKVVATYWAAPLGPARPDSLPHPQQPGRHIPSGLRRLRQIPGDH